MRRVFRKGMAVALAAAMVVTLAPASADAAKKPSMAKKASVKVGKSTTIKVKNGKAKAKVTWKTSKKSVAKLGKQVKKGNKASVVVKGVKKGKATITATYKLGKKKTNLKCVVTVSGTTTPAAATTAPAAVATATATAAAPTATATANPTEAPTKAPSATPKPSPTPSPKPKNTNLDANKLGLDETQKEIAITVDGNIDAAWEDSVSNPLLTDITKTDGIRGGESKITDATAKILWGEKAAYVLVEVTKANPADTDSVTIYFDENAKATEKTVKKETIKAGEAGKSTKTDKGYVVEAKFDIATAKEVDSTASIEIQLNEGNVTTNYYDTRSAMNCNAETGEWTLGDAEVTVDKDPAKMGQLTLLKSMAQSTLAYKTDKGAEIRAAADIDNGEWDVPAKEGEEQTVKAKKVNFVDPKFWTEAYGDNPAIKFPNYNPNAYAPEGRKSENITLMKEDGEDEEGNKKYVSDPELAKGYVIWDEDYIYVMFDIKDADVTVNNDADYRYLADSTEFFLDEDNSKPSSYSVDGDEIQIRVAPIDNGYSSNDTNTGNYELVAHAAKVTEGVGYQTQYIIKLNNKHKHGDIMGMDLQVNDCSSIDVKTTDENGTDVDGKSSARACTITAYDTANEDWQNPSYFGRVKLIDPNATPGDDTPGDDTPGDDTPSEVVTSDALVVKVAANNVAQAATDSNQAIVEYGENSTKISLEKKWGGFSVAYYLGENKAPVNIKDYSKCVVNVTVAEGEAYKYTVGYITDLVEGDYWKTNGHKVAFTGGAPTEFEVGTKDYEFDLTALTKSTGEDKDKDGNVTGTFERDPEKAVAIYIQALGGSDGKVNFTLNSIKFVK